MSVDLNNTLGVSSKYSASYFRSWAAAGASSGMIYGAADPGVYQLAGSALAIQCNDSGNGTKIAIRQAGLYFSSASWRINTGATTITISTTRTWSDNTSSVGTSREISTTDIPGPGNRYACSGFAYLIPGDYVFIASSSNPNSVGFTWQIALICPAL